MRLLHFGFKNQNRSLKGTAVNRDGCRGSSVSSGAKLPVVSAESAPMNRLARLQFNVLSIDYVRVTNCFYDYDCVMILCLSQLQPVLLC